MRVIVAGLGPSIDLITPELGRACIIVGLNDIGRHLDPTHLVVQDPLTTFSPERIRYIQESRAEIVWVPPNWDGSHPRQRPTPMCRLPRRGAIRFDVDWLWIHRTSAVAAVHVAFRLGADRIGLAGVDLLEPHSLARQRLVIDSAFDRIRFALDQSGVHLVNLSAISTLCSLPRESIHEFMGEDADPA